MDDYLRFTRRVIEEFNGRKVSPMSRTSKTLSMVATEILSMYRALGGKQVLSDAIDSQNLLGKRLELLTEAAEGRMTLDRMTQDQAIVFQETLLDATALQCATGGRTTVYDSLHTRVPTLLGRSRDRRAKLLESDNAQLDWHFQILVQAWAAEKAGGPVKDLRLDPRFKGKQRVCDFCIPRENGRIELFECKRVHSETDQISDPVQSVVAKLIARLPCATDQLSKTAAVIGTNVCDQHLLIDISAYNVGSSLATKSGAVQVEVGGFQEDQLSQIATRVAPHCSGLARLTLCWHAPVKLDGLYRAIIQCSRVILDKTPATALLDYDGWTVEGYPLSNAEYREFRVSRSVRSIDWIVTSYNSMSSPETFLSIGPEERLN